MSENPERGCGTKAPGGTYCEGPTSSTGGALRTWAWLLGDGHSECIPLTVPPRQMIVINPAATITICAIVKDRQPYFEGLAEAAYLHLLQVTKNQGVADHVGEKYYSAYSFAEETKRHGPSRRIPKAMAKRLLDIVWSRGPIPMLFTHNRMPIFNSPGHFDVATEHAMYCLGLNSLHDEDINWNPTWQHPEWSQYSDGYRGDDHVLIPILRLLDELDRDWRNKKSIPAYVDAKEFFSEVRGVEQAVGMSWMKKITHCAKEDGTYDEEILEMQHYYGKQMVHTIDLEELEEEE
ncbi:hypothetical protein LCGC14_1791850 [marine sediment metagenome]|uniref:Uncharacterized protein n=1 Tax=marine sediment metagenome TaxID=412755 RepID=A0A0F9GSB7_9ZZZZ